MGSSSGESSSIQGSAVGGNGNGNSTREGSLDAPTRHPLDWKSPEFFDEKALHDELERVYDICHGCRRCVSLCDAFPTLFDLVDESKTMEVDGVDRSDYVKVVDQCFLCDLCYQTKCPYVPPHEWNVDFPHLMLRAKAFHRQKDGVKLKHKLLSSTTVVGKIASIPVINQTVNATLKSPTMRPVLEKMMGLHRDAELPEYQRPTLRKRYKHLNEAENSAQPAGPTRGRVAIFATCYGNHNAPDIGQDLIEILRHNNIAVRLSDADKCCGMPKLEQGNLDAVEKYKNFNIPRLAALVEQGWDIITPIPSCTLMFKQELPLMFPEDEQVQQVRAHTFDPFEYLIHRHKAGLLNTEFKNTLGKVAWHVPCHQRVQNIGLKTRDVLQLVPESEIVPIERCSGHDGTYGVRKESYEKSQKIARPVRSRVNKAEPDWLISDCPMAAVQVAQGLELKHPACHPANLLAYAYGLRKA